MSPRMWTAAAAMAGTAAAGVVIAVPASARSVPVFANCTALHARYLHGVARTGARDTVRPGIRAVTTFTRNTAVYTANRRLDRDHDGIACERR